jgi:plastocyanin
MQPLIKLAAVVAGLACVSVQSASAHDHDHGRDNRDDSPVVTVAFGAGLNTAQPGNPANHHVLPAEIKVTAGDVVNFVVSGLHVIRVFDKGVSLKEVKAQIPAECQTNPPANGPFPATCAPVIAAGPVPVLAATAGPPATSLGLPLYYEGLNSLAPPMAPPFAPISVDQNRVEAVQFTTPGRYLVICAVLPHFNDGMTAWVVVDRPRARDDH